jgi:hypothetical protein
LAWDGDSVRRPKLRTIIATTTALDHQFMHIDTASAPDPTIVGIADQLLDRFDAAQFIRETIGVPIEVVDLERHAKAGTGPVFRRWGRKALYRRSDLTTWAVDRLSPPITPRREASR